AATSWSERAGRPVGGRAAQEPVVGGTTGLGTGGGSSRATTIESNPHVLWALSQNGLFADRPHRHQVTPGRPAGPDTFHSWSAISKSPSTRSDPLFITVIRVPGIQDLQGTAGQSSRPAPATGRRGAATPGPGAA